jgi:hypothetical protein
MESTAPKAKPKKKSLFGKLTQRFNDRFPSHRQHGTSTLSLPGMSTRPGSSRSEAAPDVATTPLPSPKKPSASDPDLVAIPSGSEGGQLEVVVSPGGQQTRSTSEPLTVVCAVPLRRCGNADILVLQGSTPLPKSSSSHGPAQSFWAKAFDKLSEKEKKALPASIKNPGYLDEVVQLIRESKPIYDQKYQFQLGGKTFIARELADKVLTCVETFKEIGDIAVQYDPVHAALPWAAFRLLLQVCCLKRCTYLILT